MLETLIRLLRESGFKADSEVLIKLTDAEISRIMQAVSHMVDVIDPDTCPDDLLDLLASLFGVPFLPAASYQEKIDSLQKAIMYVDSSKFPRLAELLGVNLNNYQSIDEQRLALWEAAARAPEPAVDSALRYIGLAYLLGVMTPAQKRAAIKQALAWYKQRGTLASYQLLLQVFGLQADLKPLWTKDYESFWEEPDGRTVFEGGEWYPTPHYTLKFRKVSDEGELTLDAIRLYAKLVQEEVQPIQCVLNSVSFSQELVDYVEFSDEQVIEIPLSFFVDIVYWPWCDYQDRGKVLVEEARRDYPPALRDGSTYYTASGQVMVHGLGRGSGYWNDLVAKYLPIRSRSEFLPGYEYIPVLFLRSNPKGPGELELQRNGRYVRDSFIIVAEEGTVDGALEHTLADGWVWEAGTKLLNTLPRLRDPEKCLEGAENVSYSGSYEFADVVEVKDIIESYELDLTEDTSNYLLQEESIVCVDHQASQDYYCQWVWQRDGHLRTEIREGFPIRVENLYERWGGLELKRDGTVQQRYETPYYRGDNPKLVLEEFWRNGLEPPASDRSGRGFKRDLNFDRTAYSFYDYDYPRRDEDYCVHTTDPEIFIDFVVHINLDDPSSEAEMFMDFSEASQDFANFALTDPTYLEFDGEEEEFRAYVRYAKDSFIETTCVTVPYLRDGSFNTYRDLDLLREGYIPTQVTQSEPRWFGNPRLELEVTRCGAPFNRDGAVTRNTPELYPARDGTYYREAFYLRPNVWFRVPVEEPPYSDLHEQEGELNFVSEFKAIDVKEDEVIIYGLTDEFPFDTIDAENVEIDTTVNLRDGFYADLYREDNPGVRSCARYTRFQGHWERDWDISRDEWCDPIARLCGSVTYERTMESSRDGSITSRWSGGMRSIGWPTRDVVLWCGDYRRREGGAWYADFFDIEFSADLEEDYFNCWSTLLRDTDWDRSGDACFFRDGTNCCMPGDYVEVLAFRCVSWDTEGCNWDDPNLVWDPT